MPIKPIIGIPGVPGTVGIWDDDPDNIAAHAAQTTVPHDLGATWFSKYIARGRTLSGIPTGQACWFAEDFTDIARWTKIGGIASLAAVTTLVGGVARLTLAAGDHVGYDNGDAVFGSPRILLGNGRFYLATRAMLAAGPPADGAVFVGALGPGGAGSAAYVGYDGAFDAAHFCAGIRDAVNPTESVASTVGIDAVWHDVELWCNGTNYYFSVDSEASITLVPVNPPTIYLFPWIDTTAGAVAGITLNLDKYLCVFPQAA